MASPNTIPARPLDGVRVLGFPGEPPVRPNLSLGDTLAGLHAVLGILLAYIPAPGG